MVPLADSSLARRFIRRTCLAAGLGILLLAAVPELVEPLHLLSVGDIVWGYACAALFAPFLFVLLAFWAIRSLDRLEIELLKNMGEDKK